jgi:ferredoxin-NADP reductase
MSTPYYVPDFATPVSSPWNTDQDETLRCVQIRQETADVKTFVLAAHGPRNFRYLPGQFITLELDIGASKINRCYTLSSTPTRPDLVSITVKRVPGGTVSNWLHDKGHVGMILGAMGPSGEFSCFKAPAASYLFLSGGSGVTPLMSMARALHDLGSDDDIVFVQCTRTLADVLFAEELTLMARNMPNFRIALVCERHTAGSNFAGHLGRLDAARLTHIAPDFMQRDVYACGPAPFMAGVRGLLVTAGFDMPRYREESFSFETQVAETALAHDIPETQEATEETTEVNYKIELKKMGDSFICSSDKTILQAAVAAGFRLPSSCSGGACGTCKTKKLFGTVEMKHAGGIRQREIDQGWFLPCCSKPTSNVILDR